MIARARTATATASRALSLLAVLGLLALALLLPAAPAGAAATGNTTLVVAKGKQKLLKKRGVRLKGVGSAVTEGRETRLQVVDGTVASSEAQLANSGALKLVAGKGRTRRVVRLSGLRTSLAATSSLRGKLKRKGKERVLFDIRPDAGALVLDGLRGTASLGGARLVWRRGAVRAVSRRLGVKVPRGFLGRVRAGAVATAASTPVSGPVSSEPPLLARPASAVDVTSASVAWWVRSSWIDYVATGAGTSAIEGAVPGAMVPETVHPCVDDAGGGTEPRVYEFGFPFASGWYDPPTGTTALYGVGGLHFAFPGHGIDLTVRNPEIELNGAASRAIFRLRGAGDTPYNDTRAALLDLHPAGPPAESPPGTFTYTAAALRGTLTADGLSVFGGFYSPPNNHGFGCFALQFTVPTM